MKEVKKLKKNDKIENNQTTQIKKEDESKEKKTNLNKYFNKRNITFIVLLILDISLVIYSARLNVINYAVVLDEEVFVSKTRYLLLGRNYVNVVIIAFFYVYICLMNKFFLKGKNSKKFLLWLLIILVVINIVLFALFTKKVY